MDIKRILLLKKKERGSVTKIANRLGSPGIGPHEWLVLTPKDKMPKPDVVYFPKPPKGPDGSLLYDRIPNKIIDLEKDLTIIPAPAPNTLRKRPHEETQLNGTEGIQDFLNYNRVYYFFYFSIVTIVPTGPPTKRPNKDPMPSHCPSPEQFAAMMAASGQPLSRHHVCIPINNINFFTNYSTYKYLKLNGKPKIAQMARTGNGRKQVISWMDAPDDVYFRATAASK